MEERSISLSALLPVIRDVLAAGGEFSIKPRGKSMLPYLREGRDSVVLSPLTQNPKKGDILLYLRANGAPILHRVVRVERNGTLSMRGDNQYFIERGIRSEQVVAIVKRFSTRGHERHTDSFSSRLYLLRRRMSYPFRYLFFGVLRRVKRLLKGVKTHG
ncbi:MAG: hypothetical protein E7609_01795 [Ruminococcaceae bacterium]|nr:hypothetical protein [Oscillospiraceae bacterium]